MPCPPTIATRVLALERLGWLEYGVDAVNALETDQKVYYAKVLANAIGFLGFLRQFAGKCSIDLTTVSLGIGLTGVSGAILECITNRLVRGYAGVTPPEGDNFLFLRSCQDVPWDTDAIALEFAEALLDHWNYSRPGWLVDTPEFEGGTYKGELFHQRFQGW